MILSPDPLRESLFLIRLVSLLVPAAYRPAWREEWEAEVWYAWTMLREREERPAALRVQLRSFCWGSFADAAWHLRNLFDRDGFARGARTVARSPWFCVASLAAIIVMIGMLSGGLPMTRAVLLPLPYEDGGAIATLSQGGLSLAVRSGIPSRWVAMWRSNSRSVEEAATYSWREEGGLVHAAVSENFFTLLGAGTAAGRSFARGDALACADCAIVSSEWFRAHSDGLLSPETTITTGGRRYRIVGVLEPRFWFLSREIAVWTIAPESTPSQRTGVVVRLASDTTAKIAQNEMNAILDDDGQAAWDRLIEVSPVQQRVRSVFGSFALALCLAVVMTVAGLRPRMPKYDRQGLRRGLFFVAKTVLGLLAVLLVGLEFTRAPSITMIGGTDVLTEPLSTWLFLIGSLGVLSWSIFDQRRRCRVCLSRLGLAAHVGCPGCLLLNWAGTELVCMEGHGMLHVPEMQSSWREAEQWTALDESWMELFQR